MSRRGQARTYPSNASWLADAALDRDHDGSKFTRWRALHPSSVPRWYGEVDYVGPCVPSRDRDCDRWDDAHDNCVYAFNPTQADGNDDGVGDACADCPCDPSNDFDQDGQCQVLCSWQEPFRSRDNCARVYNPTQDNCNAKSEEAAQQRGEAVETLGDACDPVPCPRAEPRGTSAYGGAKFTCSGNTSIGYTCVGRNIVDGVQLTYVQPEVKDSTQIGPPPISLSHQTGDVRTHARFCQSNPALGYNCFGANQAMRDIRLADFTSDADELLSPSRPYHRVTMTIGGASAPRGTSWIARYPGAGALERWDYVADNNFWTTGVPKIPAPGAYPNCGSWAWPGTCLDGVLWTHADSLIGTDAAHATDVTGSYLGVHGKELANAHVSVRPDAPIRLNIDGIAGYRRICLLLTLPDPPLEEAVLPEKRVLVARTAFDGNLFALERNGSALNLTSYVTPLANKVLGNGAILLSPVEPDARWGTNRNIQAVAMSATGRISELVVRDAAMLKAGSEVGVFPFLSSSALPASRSNPVGVYSRSAGGVFLLGGRDAANNPMRDLWFIPLGRTWGEISLTNYIGRDVLAATYSFADKRLWVFALDGRGNVLLYRIDPRTGASPGAGQWTYSGTYVRHGLSVDRDGSVLLYARASSGAAKVARLRVGTNGLVTASTMDRDEPGLAMPPIVDENGYSLLRDNNTTERLTALRGVAGTFSLAEMF